MNLEQPPPEQRNTGTDPRSKRNSGLFAFFKWFKPGSRESIDSTSRSSSLDSLSSIKSAGTVASFSFVPPNAYEKKSVPEKSVQIGPETDTYKARLKQRDRRRECDKNVTLRKKYNLFFNRDSLLKPGKELEEEENSKSLPLMTRGHVMDVEEQKAHRRTNSESSKVKKAGAYLHVKGKRRAPQPPTVKNMDSSSTTSLKRKKRLAPTPPLSDQEVLCNDSLKLDHGVLKPVKEDTKIKTSQENITNQTLNALSPSSSRTNFVETPVSPRPWYKRNSTSKEALFKKENKYEPVERLPDVQFMRNSTLDLTLEDSLGGVEKDKKKDEKRKSGMSFLTNISELDREASEIIKNNKTERSNNNGELLEIPEFMKPKVESQESLVSPKRRSARDLIARFNAITNVTKVTVFGVSQKDKYFGKQQSLDETRRQENMLENHKRRIEEIDKKKEDRFSPLMKSESASAVKLGGGKSETPKLERKSWKCPKCNLDNEYWRIICHVCSAIKPYFDDFSSSSKSNGESKSPEVKISISPKVLRKENLVTPNSSEKVFERSKTQIGFSALASYNANNKKKTDMIRDDKDRGKVDDTSKKEEREKLKRMLIEMKNSLPKRKSNILMKQNSRTSIIMENPEECNKKENDGNNDKENKNTIVEKSQGEKVAEILIGSTQTIYENIKVRKTDNPKPVKVSSAAQTSSVVKKIVPESSLKKLIENHKVQNVYEPMKVQDFEDIYSDKSGKSAARIYANLAQNDELSLFFNVPKNISNLRNNLNQQKNQQGTSPNSLDDLSNANTDTIEINRLLRRLETAIAKGDMTEAAIFAKELAQLKVNCSVVRQKPQGHATGKKKGFQIEMYVEDKVSHRGPFPIDVTESQTVAELKDQICREFEIPVEVQRWILGKELVVDESTTLGQHKITEGCPVFLYLVAPEKRPTEEQNSKNNPKDKIAAPASVNVENSENNTKPKTSDFIQKDMSNTKTQITNKITEITQKEPPAIVMKNKEITIETQKDSKISNGGHTPKIVNVIPKSSENLQNLNTEIIKMVHLQEQNKKKCTKNDEANISKTTVIDKQPTSSFSVTQIPVSVTEIKVDIRPYTSKALNLSSKKEETGLVRAKTSKVEVRQAPPATSRNIQEVSNKNLVLEQKKQVEEPNFTESRVFESSKSNSKHQETSRVLGISNIPVISTKVSIETTVKTSKVSPPISNSKTSETSQNHVEPKPSPSTSKIPLNNVPQTSKHQLLEAPKAKTEDDFEELDSKTLKPEKEWECLLCTLLNPISSNVCAVCSWVRVKKTSLRRSTKKNHAPQPQKARDETYLQLVNLDSTDLVPNVEAFECVVCFLEVPPREGATLRECLHQFCRECLARTVEFAEDAEVKCPYRDEDYSCNTALQDREIKAVVSPAVYEQHLAKSVAQAENKMDKSFHCKTPDCRGWCVFEDNVNEFRCPVCRVVNCLTCQAIHDGLNCKQYQERMKNESDIDEDAKRTKDMLEEMVEKGEAITCPTCKVILMKKWGCDWLRCSMCKTEICWVTRGPRWGPGGKGDTSGGCQCGLNGVKCHPQCNYCH